MSTPPPGSKAWGICSAKRCGARSPGESAIKPEYTGDGLLVLEPTYRVSDPDGRCRLGRRLWCWMTGCSWLANPHCSTKRSCAPIFSSAVAGGEGLFNLSLNGSGVFCIESRCPKEELIEITLQDDVLKVDGNYAIAWSKSLDFTVERSGKSLIGSAASGEGPGQRIPRHRQGADDAHRQNAQHLIGPAVALLFGQKGAGSKIFQRLFFFYPSLCDLPPCLQRPVDSINRSACENRAALPLSMVRSPSQRQWSTPPRGDA